MCLFYYCVYSMSILCVCKYNDILLLILICVMAKYNIILMCNVWPNVMSINVCILMWCVMT